MPLLSVVVPFHNVETYVEACLESLARQTLTDLEVVLVDDGATDGSRALVEARCARDPRFRLVDSPGAGPGPARNVALGLTRGEFLAFVDSDDMVAWDGFERMVGSLQASGSDVAVAMANRFSSLGASPSYVHGLAVVEDATGTHLRERPELVLDRMVWNKVYRRELWDRAGLEFPALLMGEDYPVSLGAHLAADAVDLLTFPFYFWRERDGGEPQITQRNAELGVARDRLSSCLQVLDLIEGRAPVALPLLRRHLLEVDLSAITGALRFNGEEDQQELLGLARTLLARLGPDAAAGSTPFHKVRAARISAGDRPAVVELEEYQHHHGRGARAVRAGRFRPRYSEQLPGYGLPGAPAEAYRIAREDLRVGVHVEDAAWNADRLDLRVLVDSQVAVGENSRISLWWQDGSGTKIPAPLARSERSRPWIGPDLVALHTWLDAEAIDRMAGADLGMWSLWIRVRSKEIDLHQPVDGPPAGRARYLPCRAWAGLDGVLVQPYRRPETGFTLWFRRPRIALEQAEEVDGSLVLTGRSTGRRPDGELVLSTAAGACHRYPVEVSGDEGSWQFRVAIDADDLVEETAYTSPFGGQTIHTTELHLDGGKRLLPLLPGFRATVVRRGGRVVLATRGIAGNLQVLESRITPVVDAIRWTGETTLAFSGTWDGEAALPATALVEHYEQPGSGVSLERPLVVEGNRYTVEVDVLDLLKVQREDRDPYDGPDKRPWHLVIPFEDHRAVQSYDRDRLPEFAEPRTIQGHRVAPSYVRNDVVRLEIAH